MSPAYQHSSFQHHAVWSFVSPDRQQLGKREGALGRFVSSKFRILVPRAAWPSYPPATGHEVLVSIRRRLRGPSGSGDENENFGVQNRPASHPSHPSLKRMVFAKDKEICRCMENSTILCVLWPFCQLIH